MHRRHGFLAGFALLALAISLLWSGALSAASYNDPQGHFSFTVPDGWQQVPQPTGVTLPPGTQFAVAYIAPTLKTNNFQANFNVITATVPAGGTVAQVASAFLSSVAQAAGYQAGPAAQTLTLGGVPAAAVQYTLAPSGQPAQRYEHVLAINGSTAYVLTFTADPADFAALLQQGGVVLSSFAFAAAPAVAPAAPAVAPAAPPVAPAAPAVAPPAAPRTGGGFTADFVRRLGDG